MTVTKSLYEYLKTTSRFLKFNDKTKSWEEITSLAARDKVGHALRFAINTGNTEKKRMKSKRGHRRAGSDFSAASLTSISSQKSANTAATATSRNSDGGPQVQSLMSALSNNFNLSELQGAVTTAATGAEHPLRATSSAVKEHPLFASKKGKGHRRRSSASSINTGGRGLHRRRSSSSSINTAGPSVLETRLDQEDLDFLRRVNGSSGSLQRLGGSNSNHGSENELPSLAPPPIKEVVTTSEQQKRFDGEFSMDFLSMLQEPIYEFDIDGDFNEDL